MDIHKTADRIEAAAERLGYTCPRASYAQTGTIYLYLQHDNFVEEITVRVADHGECYCSEDISVDPDGLTVDQAVEWLARRAGQPVPGWIKANRTRAANRARIEQAKREERERAAQTAAAERDADIERNRPAIIAWAKTHRGYTWTNRWGREERISKNQLRHLARGVITAQIYEGWLAAGRPEK